MKYQATIYAKAFVDVAVSAPKEKEGAIVSNFIATVEKNGDMGQMGEIVRLAERLMMKKTGRRMLSVESARPLVNARATLGGIIGKRDAVEEKINPDLVAGVKIIIDEERQFDGTLKRKLKEMFGDGL